MADLTPAIRFIVRAAERLSRDCQYAEAHPASETSTAAEVLTEKIAALEVQSTGSQAAVCWPLPQVQPVPPYRVGDFSY